MMRDMKWSDAEKKVARKIFDAAYMRECNDVTARLKDLALKASAPEDIWKILDLKYIFFYSYNQGGD